MGSSKSVLGVTLQWTSTNFHLLTKDNCIVSTFIPFSGGEFQTLKTVAVGLSFWLMKAKLILVS